MKSEARISLRVYPNAPRNEVVGFAEEVLRVKISAPPLRGKANRELLAFLGQRLGVKPASLTIVSGHTSRTKTLAVSGLSREEVLRRLSNQD